MDIERFKDIGRMHQRCFDTLATDTIALWAWKRGKIIESNKQGVR